MFAAPSPSLDEAQLLYSHAAAFVILWTAIYPDSGKMSTQHHQDLEHLRLLSIFHYIAAAVLGCLSCLPVFHLTIGIVMIVAPQHVTSSGGAPPPEFLGWIFAVFAGVFMLLGWSFAVCLFLGGLFLARRKRYLFCLVVAGIACLWTPIGTVLGVFTIIVLMRPAVKQLFRTGSRPEFAVEG